jgi:hypothetical protein
MNKPVASITIDLYDDGALSISGNIGDVRCALGMIDAAREAVAAKLGKPTTLEPHGAGLIVPNYDVPVTPNERLYPLNGR